MYQDILHVLVDDTFNFVVMALTNYDSTNQHCCFQEQTLIFTPLARHFFF